MTTGPGVAAWSLLLLCLLACVSPSLWVAAGFLFWLAPAFYPTDLKRPQGFGAWTLWVCWTVVAAFFCREPLMAAGTCADRAAGVVLFALAYSWWGRPHRRAWLALLWSAAAAWGGYCAYASSYDAAAAGLLIAALGSCARVLAADIQEGSWRWLTRTLSAVFLALIAALLLRQPAGSPAFSQRTRFWRAGAVQMSARPVTGFGPGLFSKGALRFALAPQELPARIAGMARSEWVGEAAETGAIGAALLLIAILFSLPAKTSREWERQAAGGAFLGLAVFAALEEVLKSPVLLVLWFSALACAAPGFEEQEARPFRLAPLAASLGAIAVLLCAAPGRFLKGPLKRAEAVALGVRLSPADPALEAESARVALSRAPAQIGLALAWLDRAIADSPRDARYPHWKAEVFRSVGAGPEADLWDRRAAALERDVR